ncbi:uncharacterized protein METZ01_LOCUS275111 [marine metagenome]|uniref:Uncharacterized protein n=1 Tax=marine metagenome TaxID=408172 RepID=A0A382KH23_9ZZZZ
MSIIPGVEEGGNFRKAMIAFHQQIYILF